MKIFFATSECAPFSKSGGLADVAFSLPPALKATGDDVLIITPYYKCVKDKFAKEIKYVKNKTCTLGWRKIKYAIRTGELNGVKVYFIDNEDFFNRDKLYGYDDDKLRFAFFSKVVVDLALELDFVPDIIHCNDWETALAVIYLEDQKCVKKELSQIKSVYTIHNIAYQGQFGRNEMKDTFGLDDGWYEGGLKYVYQGREDINLMKGAMLIAHAVSTVSQTYARELHTPYFGAGLHEVVDIIDGKLYGILNGIDVNHYDPKSGAYIPYKFSSTAMAGKAKCKKYIQEKFGLLQEENWPLFAAVARLNEQKGFELIKEILPKMMKMGVQLIVFGQGEQRYIDYFNWAKSNWPGQIGFSSDYTEKVASEIFAGADFYLMPSRFEPCGLSQMMAMRYGTIPVVHETGGLKDSVRGYREFDGIGDGFSFMDYTPRALYLAILAAVKVYFGDVDTFKTIRRRCMVKDLSWDKSADQYNRMYNEISKSKTSLEPLTYFEAYENVKGYIEALDKKNRSRYPENYTDNLDLRVQYVIRERGEGEFRIHFTKDETIIEPLRDPNADVYVEVSYDTMIAIFEGKMSPDKLFLNGQMKITGNYSKGALLKNYLRP